MKLAVAIAIGGASLAAALGFSTPASFAEPAHEGGGGGRFFTGSLKDGFACDVCHEGGDAPSLAPTGVPRVYEPGMTYTIDLQWPEPHLAVVGEWVDDDGQGFGTLTLPPESILLDHERCGGGLRAVRTMEVGTDDRVVFAVPDCGASQLRVQWTAPEDATSVAHLHLAAVAADGDGGIENDGAVLLALEIPSTLAPDAGSGCAIAARDRSFWLLVVVLLRRRRSW